MSLFELPPEAQSVQLAFEPVMMPRDGEKDAKKKHEGGIAGLIPSESIWGHRGRRAGEEDDESPASESRAGLGCLIDPAGKTAQCSAERRFPDRRTGGWLYM